ncbi:MAG TPA: response regulator [Anaerolineales bacterium]|nr:response regulator [Anaerolineales bacterium]
MSYKVFFVEDEIIAREGIRDNVDWQAGGFEFCGEASDGEMALPLLRTAQPDVLITDIKMPFMDGLQLSKIVRERMPWVKIIILSGHDEFADGIIYGPSETIDMVPIDITPPNENMEWTTDVAIPPDVKGCYILLSVESKKPRTYVNYALDISDQ